MRYIRWIILLVAWFAVSCNARKAKILPVVLEYAYNSSGRVEKYRFDEAKPKVITVLHNFGSLARVYDYTPKNKINQIIASNPEFEFIFYLNVSTIADTVLVKEKLAQYNVTYPVYIDYDETFFRNNSRLGKWGTSYICDENNRIYGLAMIGTTQSFFDVTFAKTKPEILK